MEDLRHVLDHGVVRVAGLLVRDRAVVPQGEDVKVPETVKKVVRKRRSVNEGSSHPRFSLVLMDPL